MYLIGGFALLFLIVTVPFLVVSRSRPRSASQESGRTVEQNPALLSVLDESGESSSRPNLRLLVPFESLSETAHRTGKNHEYAEKAVELLGGASLSKDLSSRTVRRVEQAEDRYRDKVGAATTEMDVAETFNRLAGGLKSKSAFSPLSPNDVHGLRKVLHRYSPSVFRIEDQTCSPIEAALLMVFLVYNSGNLRPMKRREQPSQDTNASVVSGGVRRITLVPSISEALRDELSKMSSRQLDIWLADTLQQLHI